MNRNEQQMYKDISSLTRALERLVKVLEKIIKELKDIRGVMNKAYLLFWGASILLLLILIVPLF